jgi:allophanate hydrolase subunit 2
MAVAGGIDVPLVMGSRSTYTLVGMGGFEGRGLIAGDEVALCPDGAATPGRSVPEDLRPVYGRETELRLVVGLASYRLTPDALAGFFETTWTVTPDANRIGYRYRGGELHFMERTPPHGAGSDPANVTDIGYPVGSIQVPGGVEPIALLCDAVTGGGYATIATIISADLDRAGQSKTNDTTRFVEVGLDEALQARHDARARLDRVREALGAS